MCNPPKIRFGSMGRLSFSEALRVGYPLNIIVSHMREDKDLSAELSEYFKKSFHSEFIDGIRIDSGLDYSRVIDNLFTDDIYGKLIWSLYWKTHKISEVSTMDDIAEVELRIAQLVNYFG